MSAANKDSVHHVALAAESPEAGRSSTAAHTPGPWSVRTLGSSIRVYSQTSNNAEICSVAKSGFVRAANERKSADARLIAAAPTMAAEIVRLKALNAEMLAALERSLTAIDDWLNTYAPDMCDEARVAEARKRISTVGTLYYIATIQEQNRSAIARATGDV